MANIVKLKNKIEESGMTMKAISEKSGIVRETLYNRMNGVGEFTASEIVGLTKALKLSIEERDSIFLS
ncbi:helix-turn-helix domain-containing protein [Faecalicoccus pleomorphus]|uniref:helix-turn-helix domain-containing protein n=1 Tax=Faecalicoccus pleomorphus TaxID=1323 RepID=UPI003DA66C7C